jgi:hypothetical protein
MGSSTISTVVSLHLLDKQMIRNRTSVLDVRGRGQIVAIISKNCSVVMRELKMKANSMN